MDLIKYNEKMAISAFGFNNLGFTCYFNSLLQSMLSCTSLIEELLKHKNDEEYIKNPITNHMIQLIELTDDIKSNELQINNLSTTIWRNMIMFLHVQKNKQLQEFSSGQQCAREGYHYLMESLEDFDGIQNLFLHRYKTRLYCFDCKEWVSKVECDYSLFEVQANLKTEQLERFKQFDESSMDMNQFLNRQDGYVDKDYKCPNCNVSSEKYRRNVLVMAPEVLVVMAKKYTTEQKLDIYTDFPKTLTFKGHDKKKDKLFPMYYEAVAQIEHIGGLNGGHYWSICRRNDGWYKINDNHISKSEFKPTKNTYIVMYHIMNK
jgi:ubiquitin C-terminal hydrolase